MSRSTPKAPGFALLCAMRRVVFTILAVAGACVPSMAATLRVDPSGSGDAATVRGGIALGSPGDTILIVPALYFEDSVHIDKDITLLGLTGDQTERPTIDGAGTGYIFWIDWGSSPHFANLVLRDAEEGIISRQLSTDCSGPQTSWTAENLVLYGLTGDGLAADNLACAVGSAAWRNITAIDCGVAYKVNDYGDVSGAGLVAVNCGFATHTTHYSTASFGCVVSYGNGANTGGVNPVPIANLITADPQLCDTTKGIYGVTISSPCLAENNQCAAPIGARSANCTVPVTGIEDPETSFEQRFVIYAKRHNHLNPSTRIRFHVPYRCPSYLRITSE